MSYLADILSCTYGSSSLELERYRVQTETITHEGIGRVGTRVRVVAECIVSYPDAASFTAALAAIYPDLDTDARTFTVTGLGGVQEFTLNAGLCQYGGPWIAYAVNDGPTPFSRKITLDITAEVIAGQLAITPKDSFKIALETRPDGLRTVTRSGVVNGAQSGAYLLETVLPAMALAYAPPHWVTTFEYEASEDGLQSQTTYRVVARENFADLPVSGHAEARDGTASTRTERDEHYRLTTIYEFDVVVVGDAIDLLTSVRSSITGDVNNPRTILRESYTLTTIHEQRLRASFVVLESADTDRLLMDVRQSVQVQDAPDEYEEKTYIGADPILVLKPKRFPRVRQRGSAVAVGAYKRPPDPIYTKFAGPPETNFEDENDTEKRVEWNYESFAADDDGTPVSDPVPDLTQITRGAVDERYVWEQS
jgi:hypothetical protein